MKYNTLGFTLHRKCNANCDICCFESNPHCTETLDINRIKIYINEAKDIDEITTIAFTGGEPFLEYEKLCDLVSYSTKQSKRATCVTNGFWATDYEKAYNMMYKLKSAGLKHLSVSHDEYHKKFIDTDNIKNLLKASMILNIPTTIAMVKIKNEKLGSLIDELGTSLYGANLQIIPCLPAGKALDCFSQEDFDRLLPSDHLRCIYSGNMVVSYDGAIYPCCSQVITGTDLTVGNFNEITLKEALYKIKNNSVLYFLRNSELNFFTDYMREQNSNDIPDYVVNPCELCAYIFKKGNLELLYPHIKEKISMQILNKVKSNA